MTNINIEKLLKEAPESNNKEDLLLLWKEAERRGDEVLKGKTFDLLRRWSSSTLTMTLNLHNVKNYSKRRLFRLDTHNPLLISYLSKIEENQLLYEILAFKPTIFSQATLYVFEEGTNTPFEFLFEVAPIQLHPYF